MMIGLFVFGTFGFVACAPVTFLNTITPSGAYKLAKNIAYGEKDRQTLDIYEPDEPRAKAPVLVFVYGGSWDSGNKGMYKFVAENFAANGYTTVVPDYRLYPEVKYPSFLQDTAAAVAEVSERYPERPQILIGHSAGAYNVVLTSVDHRYLTAENVDACQTIAGTIGLAGPYGDPQLKKEPLITIFPDRHSAQDAPINHIDGPKPPLFLAIGSDDETVAAQHGIALAERINARGGKVINAVYPDLSHTSIIKVLSRYFDGGSALKADMLEFIEAQPTASRRDFCI
jgi:acetyl esterase/lipase